jgi:hypothetical protein
MAPVYRRPGWGSSHAWLGRFLTGQTPPTPSINDGEQFCRAARPHLAGVYRPCTDSRIALRLSKRGAGDMLIFEIVGIALILLCICPLFLGGEIVSH